MSILEGALARLPRALRRPARRLALLPLDIADGIRGRDPLLPPRGMRAVGAGEYRDVGHMLLGLLRDVGRLSPSDRVLDVGCGIGRLAVPLTRYLDARGSYDGFDVSRADVEWCRKSISSRFPRFTFAHADVANAEYNSGGVLAPESFRFPYADASFDFVFATSVFSHLLPAAVARYLEEVGRVLTPKGRAYLTAFILSPESLFAMATCRVAIRFDEPIPGAYVHDAAAPEEAVAYAEADFRKYLEAAGLSVETVQRGTWSGGLSPSFQDAIVCIRTGN